MTAQAGAILNMSSAWDAVDWRTIEDNVRRLQARIVKAVQQKKWNKVKALQHLLTHSASGKLLAVRRVTVNDGRKTPGVDGELWDTPHKKLQGVTSLTARGYRPMPLRRIYIPKANGKLRPLGIPTMRDRAMQALYLLALDPVAETTADQNSYGFRQGRSCADAIEQCFTSLCHKNPSWGTWRLSSNAFSRSWSPMQPKWHCCKKSLAWIGRWQRSSSPNWAST